MKPIFDSQLLLTRKLRALEQAAPSSDFLMRHVADDLAERLGTVERHFSRAATIFCLTSHAANAIARSGKAEQILRIEPDQRLLSSAYEGLVSPPETLPVDLEQIDLAVSLMTLHEVNDIPGLLAQIRRALRPDGLFLAAMAGAGTLLELRNSLIEAETELSGGISPRVIPFADVRDAGALLQRAGFALPVADTETLTVRYANMFDLIRDLRSMGAANALIERSRKPATRGLFLRAAEIYHERYSDPDGRVRATFNIVWMSGWAPHRSQPKPLKPGSAKVSLKTVLSTPKGDQPG